MAYAAVSDVLARGGKALAGLDGTTTPTSSTVDDVFLVDTAAIIDGLLAGHGHTVPVTGDAAAALKGLNADGALVLALEARYQGQANQGNGQPMPVLEGARARWDQGLAELRAGTHAALGYLNASTEADTDTEAGAGSFHVDEGDAYYEPDPLRTTGAPHNPNTAPDLYKGMAL